MNRYSWGRLPLPEPRRIVHLNDRTGPLPSDVVPVLAYGCGRSYGDVCVNSGGAMLHTAGLARLIAFDRGTGVLRCEGGVTLSRLLDFAVPQGWFLPVTPGTQQVTVGGAIANDVHGKNHHRAGSFGCHVRALELLRSDGTRLECGEGKNAEWFAATVGGLGLTGLMTWVELQLAPIANPFLWAHRRRFRDLAEFWAINEEAERRHSYTVAWLDCMATGRHMGRGIYFAGEHAPPQNGLPAFRVRRGRVGIEPPFSLVNRASLAVFNFLYYHRPVSPRPVLTHYVPFFYPLDGISRWNRIYGRKGFYQYQCVLPKAVQREALKALLGEIASSRLGSFLAVLKTFGAIRSPGLLSFPREGVTLALDFPNRGAATHRLFGRLDRVVMEAGGALYPAKDARMPPELFRRGFPAWETFARYRDPGFSSNFWRRVMEDGS